jgi:uncharacterized protein (DUF433 family)
MKARLLNRIETNPNIVFGKPVIRGSRLPVEIILEKLAYGETEDEILKEYPFLKKEDIGIGKRGRFYLNENPQESNK